VRHRRQLVYLLSRPVSIELDHRKVFIDARVKAVLNNELESLGNGLWLALVFALEQDIHLLRTPGRAQKRRNVKSTVFRVNSEGDIIWVLGSRHKPHRLVLHADPVELFLDFEEDLFLDSNLEHGCDGLVGGADVFSHHLAVHMKHYESECT